MFCAQMLLLPIGALLALAQGSKALRSPWNLNVALVDRPFFGEVLLNDTAAGSNHETREVYSPKITNPMASTVWVVGQSVNVTWDLSNEPKHLSNPKGKLVLGFVEDGDPNEHLDLDHPVADGFNISKGHVQVRVPKVVPRNDYIVVLFGDSGNRSPAFTIN